MSKIKEAIAAHLMALQEGQDVLPLDEELVIGRVKVDMARQAWAQPCHSLDMFVHSNRGLSEQGRCCAPPEFLYQEYFCK
jgi:hypothetical protein